VIRFRLKELVADREFSIGRRVTFEEIAKQTGIHRTTLSKIAGQRGYNTTTDNIDRLCRFFSCPVERLMEYVADEM
jgi:putative transcriptional regulator